MAGLLLGIVALTTEFGLGVAIVALRDLRKEQIAQLHSVSIIIGALSLAVTAAAAQPVAAFFDSPRLVAVILALSTTFLISSLQVVPRGILRRNLEYRTLALVEGGQAIADVAATLLLAWLGFGYWALVLGNIVQKAFGSIALMVIKPWPLAVPRFREIEEALTFGWHMLMANLGYYTYSNADFLTIGKILGQAPLGAYNAAFTLSRMPAEKLTGIVLRVAPGIFSAVQKEPPKLRRYVRILTEGLSLLTFPALIGVGLVASEMVPVFLGDEWLGAIRPLQILSVGAALTSVSPIVPRVLNVIGDTRVLMRVNLVAAGVFLLGFFVGIRWGVSGVAVAWVVLQPTVVALPILLRVRKRIGLTLRAYAAAFWPAVSGCLAMAGLVLTVKAYLIGQIDPGVLLAIEVAVGALAYCGVVLLFHRSRLDGLVKAVRLLRS
jgi:PST family polysaccharide transporter